MNYLQLCARLRHECRAQGTGPSSVVGQTGRNLDWVNWTAAAYTDLQNRHKNWRWLTSRFSFATTTNQEAYAGTDATDTVASAAITRFRFWWPRTIRLYPTASGVASQQIIPAIDWTIFDRLYRIGALQNNSNRPQQCSIGLDNKLYLGPKPDSTGYTATGEYQKSAQVLAANTDTPEMPSDYHMLIVYYAMQHYAFAMAAPDTLANATEHGRRLMAQLEGDQLPILARAGPMA